MTDHTTLADADSIELQGFYDASYAQDWAEPAEHIDIDRWSKYGHDRLYINSGIPKADKYDLYVDLQTHEIVSNNETKHSGGDVEIEGDTATIVIEESGNKEHEITVSLAGDEFEEAEDDEDDQEVVADGGEKLSDGEWARVQKHLRDTLGPRRETWERSSKHDIIKETNSYLINADGVQGGAELANIAEETNVEHTALRARMLAEARKRTDYDWGYSDPVVVEKREKSTDGGEDVTDGDDEPMLVRETREVGPLNREQGVWVPDNQATWSEQDEVKYEAVRTQLEGEYAKIPLADDRDKVSLHTLFEQKLEDNLFRKHWIRMQVREEIEDVDGYVDDHLTFETVDRGESGEGEGHEVYAIVDVTNEQTDETARFRCRNAVDIGYQVFAVDDDVSDRLEALGEIALTTYKPIKGGHRQFDWE